MTGALYPEMVLGSLAPIGEAVRRAPGGLDREQMQRVATAYVGAMQLFVKCWQAEQSLLGVGLEASEFQRELARFQECVAATATIASALDAVVGTLHPTELPSDLRQEIDLAHRERERLAREIDEMFRWQQRLSPPRAFTAGQYPAHSASPNDYCDLDDLLAHIEKSGDF